jgi:hypothetical protein
VTFIFVSVSEQKSNGTWRQPCDVYFCELSAPTFGRGLIITLAVLAFFARHPFFDNFAPSPFFLHSHQRFWGLDMLLYEIHNHLIEPPLTADNQSASRHFWFWLTKVLHGNFDLRRWMRLQLSPNSPP